MGALSVLMMEMDLMWVVLLDLLWETQTGTGKALMTELWSD